MRELICIVCPQGCRLQVDEADGYAVTGNACPRGAVYGKTELTNPTRVLTSVVPMGDGHRCCPVKTSAAVPKGKIFEVMAALRPVRLTAPAAVGDVIVQNVCGTGADWVATKNME